MALPTTTLAPMTDRAQEVLLVVDDRWRNVVRDAGDPDAPVPEHTRHRISVVRARDLSDGEARGVHLLNDDIVRGGVPGPASILGPALREAARRGSAALAILATVPEGAGWIEAWLSPVVDGGQAYLRPSYLRGRFDGMLGTALLRPLVRAVYGRRLRQPLGGEVVLSGSLARELLEDGDWERDPISVGSDAWLIAKVLSSQHPVCEGWVAARRAPSLPDDDPSHAMVRVLGPVFHEMARYADQWQRIEGSVAVASFGEPAGPDTPAPRVAVAPFVQSLRLGVRELDALWSLVLSPSTRIGLRRAAAASDDRVRIDDAAWARIVYDFAVAYSTRAVDRRQLLASLTPIYLGWVAGFVRDVQELDRAGVEDRVEVLCGAFEREKRYLVRRWRWPDGFNP